MTVAFRATGLENSPTGLLCFCFSFTVPETRLNLLLKAYLSWQWYEQEERGCVYASWSALQECQETSESNSVKQRKPLSLLQMAQHEHPQVQRVWVCRSMQSYVALAACMSATAVVITRCEAKWTSCGVSFVKAEQSGEASGFFFSGIQCQVRWHGDIWQTTTHNWGCGLFFFSSSNILKSHLLILHLLNQSVTKQ